MSRHTRMERMVSSRVGDDVYQGCVINPLTGRTSSGRPCSQASSVSTLTDMGSDGEIVLDDKGSSEDDMDVVGGTPNVLTEEPPIRPESQDSTMEQSGKKVQEWVDKSFSHIHLASNQIAEDRASGQSFDTPYSPDMAKQYKIGSNYSQEDPFTVRKYLPNEAKEEEREKYTTELYQEKDTFYSDLEKKVVKSNFAEAREIIKSLNSLDNKKITEEIVKKEQKRRVTKGKKISKDKKKKGKAAKAKEDNDEIISSPKLQQQDFAGNPIIMDHEDNHRYKSLLGDLNNFMKSNKNVMVGKRQTLNLKPVNINMEEFEDWLDTVDNGDYNKNEVSERYQIKEEIFPGVFESSTNEKTVMNTSVAKSKKKKRFLKKSSEKRNNSEEKITPEYSDMPYLKQAWECDKSEMKKPTYAFEMPIEVLDEEVLNSWRSTPYFHKEREEKVIRVVPEKKQCDEMDVLIDIE